MVQLTCPECGDKFTPSHHAQRMCSAYCSRQRQLRQQKAWSDKRAAAFPRREYQGRTVKRRASKHRCLILRCLVCRAWVAPEFWRDHQAAHDAPVLRRKALDYALAVLEKSQRGRVGL